MPALVYLVLFKSTASFKKYHYLKKFNIFIFLGLSQIFFLTNIPNFGKKPD